MTKKRNKFQRISSAQLSTTLVNTNDGTTFSYWLQLLETIILSIGKDWRLALCKQKSNTNIQVLLLVRYFRICIHGKYYVDMYTILNVNSRFK